LNQKAQVYRTPHIYRPSTFSTHTNHQITGYELSKLANVTTTRYKMYI